MGEKIQGLATFFKLPKGAFLLVAAVIFLIHIFIFRDVLWAAPEVMQGQASIVRDELVPFFSFKNGYMPSATSELTGSDEFRVTYSFWTSWVRFNPVLPFALVLLNAVSAFILFYAFYRLIRHFGAQRPLRVMFVSLLGALLIHFVLLYAKIAHFYTLIFGFSLFALALSMALEQLFFATKIRTKNVVAVSMLVLFNPAIHYHIIFYLGIGMMFVLHLLTSLLTRVYSFALLKRNVLYLIMVFLLSFIPYIIYIYLTTPSSDDVFKQIPVDYWMILYSSVPLLYMLSFDSLGHVDLFRYGAYRAPEATVSMTLLFIVLTAVFLFASWRRLELPKKNLVYILFIMTLLSVWMAIGYSSETLVSFHAALGSFSAYLASTGNAIAQLLEQIVHIFISVLRFPHRFQFLFYYTAGILLGLVLLWLFSFLRGKKVKVELASVILAALVALPFLASTAYRETFLTGNFGGFLTPYRIPADLSAIKSILEKEQGDRVFILPSLESGRVIHTQGERFSFLDKFLIYYLEQPTVYTGYGANTSSKIISHMVYRSIMKDSRWWQDILVNNLGVTHILIPKHTGARSDNTVYLPGLEEKLAASLERSTIFEPSYEGQDYVLYKANNTRQPHTNVMADLSWDAFNEKYDQERRTSESLFFPVQQKEYAKTEGEHLVVTDNAERSFYNFYASGKSNIAVPDATLLPFTTDLIPSSNFTTNMFSMSTLNDGANGYNYTDEVMPTLLSLQTAQFVGIAAGSHGSIAVDTITKQAGTHRILLHAASRQSSIPVMVNGKPVELARLGSEPPLPDDHVDFTFYTADITLQKGKNTIVIPSSDKSIMIEYVANIPATEIPADFAHVTRPEFSITPTDMKDTYKVEFSGSNN